MLGDYEFKLLTTRKQLAYITTNGIHLASRSVVNIQINLFRLDTFFAEIWDETGTNTNYSIKAFTRTHKLDVYADLISLAD